MPGPDLALAHIGQIAIRVLDLDRAVTFYRDALGLRFLFQFPGLAFFQVGETRFMLSRPEKPEHDHPASVLYFKVSDIAATHATLVARGVEFVDLPHVVHRTDAMELWMTFFKDTEANLFALMNERAIAAAP
jgi:predicted enzyme related to lactoylglutathione lyase